MEQSSSQDNPRKRGMTVPRYFTAPDSLPFDGVNWDKRTAAITGDGGKVFFEQQGVEVPASWSQMATNVVVSKYFRGALGTPGRERSVRQLIGRVVDTITDWGIKDGYFRAPPDAENFRAELTHLLVEQKLAFNSPVWFNVGVEERPQCSACFINSVEDTMDSILTLAHTEGMLFKFGSGTGTNFSKLRSSREVLNGGGTASGPVSFMRGYDAFAGVIKSGGKTRRAAKMVILNAEHPDIFEYVECKAAEERKAWALIDAGYDGSFTGEAYGSVFFQNSNNSVRVTDEFMRAVCADGQWSTRAVTTGQVCETVPARTLWRKIAEAAHQCGDPGLQFDTTINAWHTCKVTARINASNPCSEYMFLDDSACNLASLNLRKFQFQAGHPRAGEFDVESYERAIELAILAQEIIVGNSRYPTEAITRNSHAFRPLGLGYANLGALLMSLGMPYDSDEGREYAAAITAIMGGRAYEVSARIARDVTGPFSGYEENRESFLAVIERHALAVDDVGSLAPPDLMSAAHRAWNGALAVGRVSGFRNAQVTVLAPTGTIGFMMDCDTTGIEPDIALVKYKRLVGGGVLKIVNGTVAEALDRLGYTPQAVAAITAHIDSTETIEGAPGLKPEHLPVFDCAFRAQNGTRSIGYAGHLRMMAAVQPFLSGAISKTVNLPNDCTVEDIEAAYMSAWRLGLKAVAVYRDGCKRSQPLSTSAKEDTSGAKGTGDGAPAPSAPPAAVRRRLPDERMARTHKFSVGGHEGYLHAGMYDDGTLGEIFVRMAKEGSTISGLMDAFATTVSLALQHGVPLQLLCDKFKHTRFEPSGWTGNQAIPRASSVTDYLFRWLESKFLTAADQTQGAQTQGAQTQGAQTQPVQVEPAPAKPWRLETDAPTCHDCGTIMTRSGACHKCPNCGSTSGCS
jgi:ribonucleoside-diphosphate reductase alpha chain